MPVALSMMAVMQGPRVWPLVGSLPGLISSMDRLHEWITDNLNTTGGTYQTCVCAISLLLHFVSCRVLLVSSAAHFQGCFTDSNDLAFASRPRLPSAQRLSYSYSTIASAPYGPHWRNLRRITTVEVLSSSRLLSLSAARSDEIRSLTAKLFHDLRRNYITSPNAQHLQRVHLHPTLFGIARNVIMHMLAGKWYYGEGTEDGMEFKYSMVDGGAPRLCLGKDMAYMKMKALAARVLERFEVVVVEEERRKDWMMERVKMGGGLHVRVKERRDVMT